MNTIKAVGWFLFLTVSLFSVVVLFLAEKLFWVWSKLFELVMGSPRTITGTNPIGAKWVVQKAAKGANYLFGKVSQGLHWLREELWEYSRDRISDNFPDFYQKCQNIYNFLHF